MSRRENGVVFGGIRGISMQGLGIVDCWPKGGEMMQQEKAIVRGLRA